MKKIILMLVFILTAKDSVSQWSEQTITPAPPKLNCVSVNIGGTEGWVGGDSGTILYTSNSGTNWYYRNNPAAESNNIYVIASVGSGFGFYVDVVSGKALFTATFSNTTYIYRTSNQGVNWITVYQQPGGRIRSISMLDTVNGYAVGEPVGGWWIVLKTTNGGLNFVSLGNVLPQNGSEISNYNTMVVGQPPPTFLFGTNNSRIYSSTNYGLNWTSIPMPLQNIYVLQLGKFIMSNQPTSRGYATGSGEFFTTDYGQTWAPVTLPGTGDIGSFYVEGGWGYVGFFACYVRGPQIYSSTNYYSPFTLQYTSPNGGNYTQISLSFHQYHRGGWGVKDNGTLSRYYVNYTGINKINSSIPKIFFLSQNYPNPFNPKTKIKFDIAKLGEVKLIILDVLGRENATLVDQQLQPGTYEAEWDGTNYSSGVYFYKLITPEYTETRKMVLVK